MKTKEEITYVTETGSLISAHDYAFLPDNLKEKCEPYIHSTLPQYATQRTAEVGDVAIESLREITEPIKYMIKRMPKGNVLDGIVARKLADDPEYLKSIARKALEQLEQPLPEPPKNSDDE